LLLHVIHYVGGHIIYQIKKFVRHRVVIQGLQLNIVTLQYSKLYSNNSTWWYCVWLCSDTDGLQM